MLNFVKATWPVLAAATLFVMGTASVAMAAAPIAPEVDSTTGVAAIALVGGAVLVIRGRLRK
jgi:hypothetical protein